MAFNYHDANQQGIPFNGMFGENNYPLYGLDQSTVLNTHDQTYLNSFFNDPSTAVPLPIIPGTPLDLNLKVPPQVGPQVEPNTTANNNDFSNARAGNVAATATTTSHTSTSPAMPKNNEDSEGGRIGLGEHTANWVMPQSSNNQSSKDSAAATSLMNLKSTQPQDQGLPFGSSGQQASWGNFSANPFYGQSMGPPNSNYMGMPAPSGQTRHASASGATRSQNEYINQLTRVQQSASQQVQRPPGQTVIDRTRHMSIDGQSSQLASQQQRGTLQAPVYQPAHPRPHVPIRFGSDGNFGSAGYRNPNNRPTTHDKSVNLLPLAFDAPDMARQVSAARAGQQQNGSQRSSIAEGSRDVPSTHSSPGSLAGFPRPNAPQASRGNAPAAAWGTFRAPGTADDDEFESEQPRKRRRSRAEREDDDDYLPGSSAPKRGVKTSRRDNSDEERYGTGAPRGSIKRRKSGYGPTFEGSSASPEADDDDDDDDDGDDSRRRSRGKQKPRENLSESQKRHNHIMSEKKRRDIINQGYADLNKLVPCLAQGKSGMSRSECLTEAASYLEVLLSGTQEIARRLGLPDVGGGDGDPRSNAAILHNPHAPAGGQYYDDQEYYDD